MNASTPSSRAAPPPRTFRRLGLLILLLLAFALRAYHLDFQSLWSDEGISLQRGALPLAQMLAELPVEHLPGYFLLLHLWLPQAGDHDFALRFLSLWPSVASVALIYRLGVDLGYWPAGMTAALLLATSGFQLWYAQEARMYSWLLATSLLATIALWRLLELDNQRRSRNARWRWGITYALSIAATVYLHLFGALVPLAQAVFVLGWWVSSRNRQGFGRWLLAATGALLLFLPWLPRVLGIFSFSGWREPGDPAEIPWRYLAAFTVSDAMPAPWRTPLVWLYTLLALAGLSFWWRTRRAAMLLLSASVLLPIATVIALALRNPDYHERYAIAVTAPLLLLTAGGVSWLDWRRWRQSQTASTRSAPVAVAMPLLAALVLASANLIAVQRLYTDTTLHKPDFRGAAQTIMAGLQPGDVVLVDGPDPSKVFLHYYTGAAPVFAVADLEDASLTAADVRLRQLTADAPHVWELLYFHAPSTVQVWLATQGWATDPTYHNGIRVTRYGLATTAPITMSLGIDFGDALRLEQVALDTLTPQPGELLRVTTDWFTRAAAPEYKFSLRLHDAAGNVVQSADYTPQNWFAPTNVWVIGQPARDQRGLLLPRNLPPGAYRLTLRLYAPADGSAVMTVAGEDVELAVLKVGLK